MAKLVYGMQQSLDGYIDHMALGPPPAGVFGHFLEHVSQLAGCLYGRRLYEIMQYWDEDQPGWDEEARAFAAAWRKAPKWVASRTLKHVGPNATLIEGDLGAAARAIKDAHSGEVDVAGSGLAASLTDLGLIDEYRLYLRPIVLGGGTPFFAGARPPLRLVGSDRIGEEIIRLTYAPG